VLKLVLIAFSEMLFLFIISSLFLPHPVYILNYITNALTCFGASAPCSGSLDMFAGVIKYWNYWNCV